VRNYNKGVQVYVTTDGVAWPQSNVNGWGNSANQHSSDGDNGVVVYNGALTIGSYNPVTGGQLWQLNPAALAGLSLTSSSPTVLEQPTTFTATLAAGQGPTYAWSFGNGASAVSGRNVVSYTYPVTGTYQAAVTATNVLGSLSAATTVLVSGSVTPTTTSLTSAPNPSAYGQSVTFTATVTAAVGVPIGTVTFTVDGVATPQALVGGVATVVTSTLTGGAHAVTATYGGDPDHLPSAAGPLTQTVSRIASATSLAFGPNPSTYGQAVTLTATVTAGVGAPTGVVTFTVDSAVLTRTLNVGGVATYVTHTLAAGSHAVGAAYSGDSNYVGSLATGGTQTVDQAATTTGLASVPNPSTYGQSVTFTATVSSGAGGVPAPSGIVTFTVDGVVLTRPLNANGVATLVTTTLHIGSLFIDAVYGGDSNYAISGSAPLAQNVIQAGSATALTSAPNPSTVGQSVTLTATVTSGSVGPVSPTGSVTFVVDGVAATQPLVNGVATVVTDTLVVGSHPITATYSGDANYLASSSPLVTQTVSPIGAPTSTPTSTSTPSPGIVFRALTSSNNGTGATTLTLPTPAGLLGGDVLVAQVVVRGATTVVTPPSGWTLIRRDQTSSSMAAALYVHVAALPEPAGFTWTFGSAQQASGGIVAYGGVDNVTPVDAHSGKYNDSTGVVTALGVTTTVASDQLLFFASVTTLTTITPPTGMAQRWRDGTSSTTSYLADQALTVAGATGNRVGTSGAPANSNLAQLVALKPAATGLLRVRDKIIFLPMIVR
jgi:hypothetical protein